MKRRRKFIVLNDQKEGKAIVEELLYRDNPTTQKILKMLDDYEYLVRQLMEENRDLRIQVGLNAHHKDR